MVVIAHLSGGLDGSGSWAPFKVLVSGFHFRKSTLDLCMCLFGTGVAEVSECFVEGIGSVATGHNRCVGSADR